MKDDPRALQKVFKEEEGRLSELVTLTRSLSGEV